MKIIMLDNNVGTMYKKLLKFIKIIKYYKTVNNMITTLMEFNVLHNKKKIKIEKKLIKK